MYKPNVSVLMSVYNETINDLSLSVNSILNQTYKNFEFIIINDNPHNNEIKNYLDNIIFNDDRIKIINNKENIGLALSLNKGILFSSGEYILRMDADDISREDRMEKQLNHIKNGPYDVVCSDFKSIDEEGKIVQEKWNYFTDEKLKKRLPIRNCVHHPTVMVRKSCLENMKGYRNFNSAQDYDLWLRMLDKDYKFSMINETLLDYRVRENSITKSKRGNQMMSIVYIRNLYLERKEYKCSKDSYTFENYKIFLEAELNNKDLTRLDKSLKLMEKTQESFFKYGTRMYIFFVDNLYRKKIISELTGKYTNISKK